MLAEALRSLYYYNTWATERVLASAERLTPEEWLAPGGAGRGSVRDTLVHQVVAQRSWLFSWNGALSPEQTYALAYEPADFADIAEVRAIWTEVDQATRTFVDSLDDSDVERVHTNTRRNGGVFRLPLWQMMLHVANHGTQHRSEVAALLTSHGKSPGDLDAAFFFQQFGSDQAT